MWKVGEPTPPTQKDSRTEAQFRELGTSLSLWIFLDPLSMARPSHVATCVTLAGPLEDWGGAVYFLNIHSWDFSKGNTRKLELVLK